MSRFLPEPPHRHGIAPTTGILIVNLGTPQAPTARALRSYLKQFLSDPRVVEIPKPIWWLILNGIILNVRPKKSAAKYASVWMKGGSPLRVHTEQQAELLATTLRNRGHHLSVTWAMRYGSPSIAQSLNQLKADGASRILIVPMYPQYAASTTATVIDETCAWLQKTRNQPEMRFVRNFHDHEGYITALEASVRQHWKTVGPLGPHDRLMISFHGLPKRSLDLGDPYFCECQKTGRLLAERLSLSQAQYQICFQSRFGKAEWLQPYTSPTLKAWARAGIQRVDLICPGFVADCLETLEEIAMEGKEEFLQAGGKSYHYIPALNENPDWINTLADLVEQHASGWPLRHETPIENLEQCAKRAQQAGAKS